MELLLLDVRISSGNLRKGTCDEDPRVPLMGLRAAVLLVVPPAHLPQGAESAATESETTLARQAQHGRSAEAGRGLHVGQQSGVTVIRWILGS